MQPAVLIVEDDASLREALFDTLNSEATPVLTADSGPAALEIIDSAVIGLVVSDLQMSPMDGATLLGKIREQHPTMPAVLMTAYGTIENAVEAMQQGAADYLVKPFAAEDLRSIVDKYIAAPQPSGQLVAVDPVTVELLQIACRVAATQVTVTIHGPSGCGKEVFARYIHAQSPRRDAPFVAINCAAIPETMLEAMLFGYEKGAFTGATGAHAGKFEQATGGTLLLDEISEMDLGLQAKLLRVIQEKEVERIGGRKTIPLDVRIVATTNRDLQGAVAAGKFREDLYYRLCVFPLHIPALRQRRGDILPLADMVIQRHAERAIALAPCAQSALLEHDWPGNVRELENLIQRTLILLRGSVIQASDLADLQQNGVRETGGDLSAGLRNREHQLILDAMAAHDGKRNKVSAALGISPRSLRYKLARMRDEGIAIPGERT